MRITGAMFLSVLMAGGGAACSEKSNPVEPETVTGGSGGSTGGGAGTSCRTFSSRATTVTTVSGHVGTVVSTLSYDRSANRFTNQVSYSDNVGLTYTGTIVGQYPSLSAFIDEVRVVPPRPRVSGSTTTYSNTPGVLTIAYTYDGSNRVVRVVSSGTNPPVSVETTYTGWDAAGRPTNWDTAGSTAQATYNDGARTMTKAEAGWVTTTTFDANGNAISTVNTPPPGQLPIDIQITNHTFETICL